MGSGEEVYLNPKPFRASSFRVSGAGLWGGTLVRVLGSGKGEFPKRGVPYLGGPYNKDPTI